MAVLYICGFSGDLPVIPCSDENIGHFERRNAYPFKFTCNSTGCSGVVVDCGSSHTFRRQSNFFILMYILYQKFRMISIINYEL